MNKNNGNLNQQKRTYDLLKILKKLKDAFSIKLVFVVVLVALMPTGFQLIIGTVEAETSIAKSELISMNAEVGLIEARSKPDHQNPAMSEYELIKFDKELNKILSEKQFEVKMKEQEVKSKLNNEHYTKLVLHSITLIISLLGLVLLTKEIENKFRTFRIALVLGIFALGQAVVGFFPFLS